MNFQVMLLEHRSPAQSLYHVCVLGSINETYRKFPIISPGLIFAQKAFLLGLFSGELIFGGACYRKEFCVSKWCGLSIKTASSNSPWAYIREGLLWEGYLFLRFGELIFGRAYFFFFFFGGGGNLRYYI